MTKTADCLEIAHSSSAILGHTSLAYRPTISDRLSYDTRVLKDCPILLERGLAVTFFCVLLVQLGQHTVSSQGKGIFLPSGLLLP